MPRASLPGNADLDGYENLPCIFKVSHHRFCPRFVFKISLNVVLLLKILAARHEQQLFDLHYAYKFSGESGVRNCLRPQSLCNSQDCDSGSPFSGRGRRICSLLCKGNYAEVAAIEEIKDTQDIVAMVTAETKTEPNKLS